MARQRRKDVNDGQTGLSKTKLATPCPGSNKLGAAWSRCKWPMEVKVEMVSESELEV
ncbi:hypothetical protein OsJ_35475 [Oryza sativa Japonica Group]|uniref:Uncharacterized protein n=1 Tax=Oryza sativa subsp. japonica TaxID=39947 RepID=A3CFM7_ORYSJ|nr:hypothetical protein OsJ_35475 [Oryza sativa Japonica Group]